MLANRTTDNDPHPSVSRPPFLQAADAAMDDSSRDSRPDRERPEPPREAGIATAASFPEHVCKTCSKSHGNGLFEFQADKTLPQTIAEVTILLQQAVPNSTFAEFVEFTEFGNSSFSSLDEKIRESDISIFAYGPDRKSLDTPVKFVGWTDTYFYYLGSDISAFRKALNPSLSVYRQCRPSAGCVWPEITACYKLPHHVGLQYHSSMQQSTDTTGSQRLRTAQKLTLDCLLRQSAVGDEVILLDFRPGHACAWYEQGRPLWDVATTYIPHGRGIAYHNSAVSSGFKQTGLKLSKFHENTIFGFRGVLLAGEVYYHGRWQLAWLRRSWGGPAEKPPALYPNPYLVSKFSMTSKNSQHRVSLATPFSRQFGLAQKPKSWQTLTQNLKTITGDKDAMSACMVLSIEGGTFPLTMACVMDTRDIKNVCLKTTTKTLSQETVDEDDYSTDDRAFPLESDDGADDEQEAQEDEEGEKGEDGEKGGDGEGEDAEAEEAAELDVVLPRPTKRPRSISSASTDVYAGEMEPDGLRRKKRISSDTPTDYDEDDEEPDVKPKIEAQDDLEVGSSSESALVDPGSKREREMASELVPKGGKSQPAEARVSTRTTAVKSISALDAVYPNLILIERLEREILGVFKLGG